VVLAGFSFLNFLVMSSAMALPMWEACSNKTVWLGLREVPVGDSLKVVIATVMLDNKLMASTDLICWSESQCPAQWIQCSWG
jgi:hypothetical protein